ncbi:hypothetical protein FOCC_FOCC009295 [Frankliniella occidentalis]|uniref:Protein eiger isoform X1 n=1 Tax=Frankliniella occidentalis TaxID=133901 RepID=A0A6J1SES5_FRAOC|nr:protein eiger isoform X1 [Frankliniella occidentalis]XP_026277121.1 protein eiger isoform X1 [Frankliniella occidentalis]XP_026277122.1 protein eiger isoform X1 [Frankliniella occidentalis]XP_026277124.1 protein eiger isoform X1 [Frankliniella occidentalis]XP_026277125.1 protein eiger isoform X1 [Frankliniella occidentalis]XP_026277126.1 protein eiger isoform X1 [Frankliniella occidentalis]XP_052126050.1 protein eiger isoform X1 [Frankliniella occidentalis]KAE8744088.1 hypothetical protei
MKIPLYQKISEKANVVPGPSIGNASCSVKQNKQFYEIENSIEIHLKSSRAVRRFIIPIFILSWLSMLLILLFVLNTLRYQIESQQVEMESLKFKINNLNQEVLSLKNLAEATDPRPIDGTKHEIKSESRLETTSLMTLNEVSTFSRKKRDTSEEAKDFKNLKPSGRKIKASGSGRNSKQFRTHRRNKIQQAQRLCQCQKCLRANNTNFSDFQAIHLKGAHPETVVESGHVGPWFVDSKAVADSKLSSSFQLREDGQSIEIKSSGLYFIYAQVYYLTSHALNSFTIKLLPKDSDSPTTLAFCSSTTVADKSTSEISCYTATVHTLQAGDRIHVQQREKHRRLIMRPGHSFLGLVKLGVS